MVLCYFGVKKLKLVVLSYSRYHIGAKINEHDNSWCLPLIYGDAKVADRQNTWSTLMDLSTHSNLPWVTLCDFNEV